MPRGSAISRRSLVWDVAVVPAVQPTTRPHDNALEHRSMPSAQYSDDLKVVSKEPVGCTACTGGLTGRFSFVLDHNRVHCSTAHTRQGCQVQGGSWKSETLVSQGTGCVVMEPSLAASAAATGVAIKAAQPLGAVDGHPGSGKQQSTRVCPMMGLPGIFLQQEGGGGSACKGAECE